ncbi:MAG TPA: hypothetical protein VL403_00025 [Candidatus Kryptonia bacterium]|nr:hypothetical protein [Candidatus Kryptonia bacterium]
MSDDELRRALRRLDDREALRELHNQYCFIQDRGHSSHAESDVQAFLALCAPEMVWDNSPDGSRAHRVGHQKARLCCSVDRFSTMLRRQ